jgi:hypothetical protein
MDSGAAVRARAISASRSAMRYWSTGAIFVYVIAASCAIAWCAVLSTTSNTKLVIAQNRFFRIVSLLRVGCPAPHYVDEWPDPNSTKSPSFFLI